jgi:4,5-dihydroxyphthalate decarboxylase
VGRKVGLGTFQTTFSVLAIGDLSEEYGLPWREVEWFTDRDEVVAFDPPQGATLRRLPEGQDIGELLDQGELAAVFRPHPPKPVLRGSKNIKRLFDDPQGEEEKYYRKNGFYPIMHLIAFSDDVLDRYPGVAEAFFQTFEKAEEISHEYYDDPNWSRMAWGRLYFEREQSILGNDPWTNGIVKNRRYLERFLKYSWELGLIGEIPTVESLFVESLRDT